MVVSHVSPPFFSPIFVSWFLPFPFSLLFSKFCVSEFLVFVVNLATREVPRPAHIYSRAPSPSLSNQPKASQFDQRSTVFRILCQQFSGSLSWRRRAGRAVWESPPQIHTTPREAVGDRCFNFHFLPFWKKKIERPPKRSLAGLTKSSALAVLLPD